MPQPDPRHPARAPQPAAPESPARRRAIASLGSVGLLAAGCGGTEIAGVGSGGTGALAGVGSGGTGSIADSSFSIGAISGFGSVIVNGIKYDDGVATVSDDLGAGRTLGQLGLGMVVEVEGSSDDATGRGIARSIRIVSDVQGAVESVDAAAGRIVVLGLPVQTGALTAWDDARGLGSIGVGTVVEVWGFLNRVTGVLRASRIEQRPAGTPGAKLRGPVAGWDPGTRSFRIGTQRLDVRGLVLPDGLADGVTVQVTGTRPVIGSVWRPERVVRVQAALASTVTAVRVEAAIVGFVSVGRFEVAGLQVDASGAAFEDGTAASLRNGQRVRVIGTVSGGRVVAQRVKLRADEDGSGSGGSAELAETEVRGTIERFTRLADFTVRDAAGRAFLIDATGVTRYERVTAAELRTGLQIEVKGIGGALIRATEIRRED